MADRRLNGIDQLPSGLYRARYRCQGCARHGAPSLHSRSFERLIDAKQWRTAETAAVNAGSHVDSRNTRTVFSCARRYVETLDHEPASRRTMQTYLAALERHPLAARRIVDVRASDVFSTGTRSASGTSTGQPRQPHHEHGRGRRRGGSSPRRVPGRRGPTASHRGVAMRASPHRGRRLIGPVSSAVAATTRTRRVVRQACRARAVLGRGSSRVAPVRRRTRNRVVASESRT